MLSENTLFKKISYKEIVAKLVDVLATNSEEFVADQAQYDKTISLLNTELEQDASTSVADLVDAIHQQIGSTLLFSCCLGLKANLDHFIDPVSRTFLDVDPEVYLRENIARQLPDYQLAQRVQEQFYATLSSKQKDKYEEGITTYVCHLETVGSKLAHYYGYILGNLLFPHVIPGYVTDAQLTLQYRYMLGTYYGINIGLVYNHASAHLIIVSVGRKSPNRGNSSDDLYSFFK